MLAARSSTAAADIDTVISRRRRHRPIIASLSIIFKPNLVDNINDKVSPKTAFI